MPTAIEVTPKPETPQPAAASGPRASGEDARRALGLRARLFLGSAALLIFTIGLAVGYLTTKAQGVAEAKILEDLKSVPAIYEGYASSQASARERQVRSLAQEAGTKALLAEVREHPETFHDSAQEFARALGARTVFFFDADGLLLARSDRAAGEEAGRDFSGIAWVDAPRERLGEASAFILEVTRERALSLVAAAPVTQGAGAEQRLNGVIAASFEMGGERARELSLLTRGETAFFANVAARDAAQKIEILTATPRLPPADVLAGLLADPAALDSLFQGGRQPRPIEFAADGDSYIATAVPIRSGGGEVIAALLVARSKEAEMAPFREIRRSLLAVGAVALLLSVPLSFALAQGLAGPIRKLAEGARQIARGDLDVSLPAVGGGEVGALARAFAGMVAELREKAQLEALVADMQRRPGDVTLRGAAPGAASGEQGLGVGRVFAGRYEILSELGRGGMGTVFRARDRELDDEVALKVLREGDQHGAQVERLRQEIKIARAITHVNVVRAFDFGEAERTRYLTMEYVPGTTLRELIDARHGVELTPALQIAKQICRGLAAVHKAGIVHGDLKPQNVMVMGNGVAKLMDFGVARPRARQEQGGLVIAGTPLYMSPEQVKGGDLDDRSDIYSAGVVMFEMFTGHCPFRGKDVAEILQMHLNDPPPDPRTLRAGLPEPLAQLILACLSKHRLQRPGSAADLDRLLMRVRA